MSNRLNESVARGGGLYRTGHHRQTCGCCGPLIEVIVLAAAPDDRVRDGHRAMAIVQDLLKDQKGTDLGETMAMAFAELGDYERAVGVQRGVIAAARDAGLKPALSRMEANLRLYEQHRPCRTLWFDER